MMPNRTFSLSARISTENPEAIKRALKKFLSEGSIRESEEGFVVTAKLRGASARELNRDLLSALRRIERKARLRADWTSGGITERFFDYVPKGKRKE
jgi:hypothetical protein